MNISRLISCCLFLTLGYSSLFAQTKTQLEDVKVEVTYAKFIGKTQQVRNLVPQVPTSKERKQVRKDRKKIVPNFVGRKQPTVNNLNALPQGVDSVRQTSFDPAHKLLIEPIVNRDGLSNGGTPHDPCGDIGKDYYIQIINATSYQVYDRQGNTVGNPINANTLWTSLGFTSAGDPIILYDQEVERWIITEFPLANQLLVAVSETSDPLGSYLVYNFGTPNFPDYPKYSVWNNSYALTTNEQGSGILPSYFIDRQALLDGDPNVMIQRIQIPGINNGPGFFVGTPVDWSGDRPPTPGTGPMVLRLNDDAWGAANQDQIDIFSINLNWNNPNNTTVSMTSVVTAPFDTNPCRELGPGFSCIPQFGDGSFDGSPEVIMHQSHYRNFGTHESIVLNFITDADGTDLSGIRWMEFRRTPGTVWSVYQEGTFAPDDGLHRFMGSICMDGRGNIGLAYNVSSSLTFPGLRFTGRRFDDPLGQMTVEEVELIPGTSNNPSSRFGDYAQMAIDPVDDRTFWFTGEYQADDGTRTRIASFKISKEDDDIGPVALASPVSSPDLTDMETVSVEISNFGLDTQTVFTVGYIFENGSPVTDDLNIVLPPDSTYIHTFTPTEDLSAIEDYEFRLFTVLSDDQLPMNDSLRVIVSRQGRNDAGITTLTDINGPLCGDTLFTGVVLSNFGTEELTSAQIEVSLNGMSQLNFNWTGSLLSGESDTIPVAISGLQDGTNTVIAMSSSPNGLLDEILDNDDYAMDFQASPNGVEVFFNIKTDFYALETTWQLTDGNNNILFMGGPYVTPLSSHMETWCIDADSCYTFTIFDATGDGICCNSGQGTYSITTASGDTLLSSNGQFGLSESNLFCGTYACVLTAKIDTTLESAPGAGDAVIMATAQNGSSPFEYSLDGSNYQSGNTFTDLSAGMYTVYVRDVLGCVVEVQVEIEDLNTATKELVSGTTFEVYPNPTDGVFRMDVSGLERGDVFLPFLVYDATGRQVQSSNLVRYDDTYTGQVSLVTQPSGVYFVRFLEDQISRLIRVVKE